MRKISKTRLITTGTCAGSLLLAAGPLLAQAPPGYYNGVDASSAPALRSSLHALVDDHQRFPYTSSATDTWNILELADQNPSNTGNILDVYKNTSVDKVGGGSSSYNREHAWPKSYGFPNDGSSNYPYTDCHALFLCNSGYNSSRSNKPFRDCTSSCLEKVTESNNGMGGGSGDSNWTSGSGTTGSWETWGDRRGDVARALFYLDVRYEGGTHGGTGVAEPDLVLTDVESLIASSNTGSNESVAYMGLLSVLLQWHADDPVDDLERQHTDAVFAFQGNRNPFVDHPEWVDCLFGGTCGGGGGGGPTAWINELHYDDSGADSGEGVEIAAPSGTDLSGWKLEAYNGNGGGRYKTVNLSGTIGNQSGGFGTAWFAIAGLQNGAPDGIALIDDAGAVVQFLSYEGAFTASSGTASGMTSVNIGVNETNGTPAGHSLQLTGEGSAYGDFTWQAPSLDSPGSVNASQTFSGSGPAPDVVWINELHYDDTGSDSNEGVELAGTAGADLSGWSLVAYNGNGGGSYKTTSLSGALSNQQGGFGTLWFAISGLQNGAPDGVALVDDSGTVVQFLSYEGSLTATNGPAAGLTSEDIGVAETSSTSNGHSLQLVGTGGDYGDFLWSSPKAHTRGGVNSAQTFAPSN